MDVCWHRLPKGNLGFLGVMNYNLFLSAIKVTRVHLLDAGHYTEHPLLETCVQTQWLMITDKTPGRGIILTGKPHCWLRTIPEIKHHPFWSYLLASTKRDGTSSCNNRRVKWSLCQCFMFIFVLKPAICPKHPVYLFLPWFWQLFNFRSESDWKERLF